MCCTMRCNQVPYGWSTMKRERISDDVPDRHPARGFKKVAYPPLPKARSKISHSSRWCGNQHSQMGNSVHCQINFGIPSFPLRDSKPCFGKCDQSQWNVQQSKGRFDLNRCRRFEKILMNCQVVIPLKRRSLLDFPLTGSRSEM